MKKIFKYTLKIIISLILLLLLIIYTYKIIGTSYCYIKTPETKEEANEIISFCGSSGLLFDVFFSKGRAKIYETYPDNFQNDSSAIDLISYYTKNEPLNHLERIDFLTQVIVDERWNKEKSLYFLLEEDFFEKNLPLEFRKNVLKNISIKYLPLIKNDKKLSEKEQNYLFNYLNDINNKMIM